MDSGRHIHPKFLAQSLKLPLKPLFHPHAECCLRHIEHPLEYPKAYVHFLRLYGSLFSPNIYLHYIEQMKKSNRAEIAL